MAFNGLEKIPNLKNFYIPGLVYLFALDAIDNNINPFNDQCSHHIETSHLICSANQLTGFYMMGTLVVKRLTYFVSVCPFIPCFPVLWKESK